MHHSDLFSSSKRLALIALCAIMALGVVVGTASPAAAGGACIVNTGTPVGGRAVNFSFDSRQYFSGEFSIAKGFTIKSILGWFGISRRSAGGEVRISLQTDGGDVPGTTLFSKSFAPDPNWIPFHFGAEPDPNPKWQGASDLNWTIKPGTYWASFVPDRNYSGLMPGGAPNPLANYASNLDGGGWRPSDPWLGIRVWGE